MSYPRTKGPSVRQLVFIALKCHPDLREIENKDRLVRYVQVSQQREGASVSSYDTITRIARMDRRKHDDHRGKDWTRNQTHAQNKVREQIINDTFGKKNTYQNLEEYSEVQDFGL